MRRLVALAVLALLVAACGGDDDTVATDTTESTDSTSTTGDPDDATDSTDATESSTTSTLAPPADGELPGEVIEIFPYEGADLAVVGVERDDTLNLRSGPGLDFGVVAELSPIDTGIIATGHNRTLDDSIWAEVTKDSVTGWANVSYLLQLGSTDDITAELADDSGELPGAETMVDLANVVGDLRASDEPPSRVVVTEDPEVGERGVITVDVIGLGDDAVGGERLHIVATPITEAFVVESVQRLTLCSRGVSDDGLCV